MSYSHKLLTLVTHLKSFESTRMNMREIKKVVIQNVHSELVLTAKQRSNIQSESPEAIQVTQDLYEEGHSGERLMEALLDLQLVATTFRSVNL